MSTPTLEQVQQRLNERGVRSVHLHFAPDVQCRPASEVKDSVALVLTAYLDGHCQPVSADALK